MAQRIFIILGFLIMALSAETRRFIVFKFDDLVPSGTNTIFDSSFRRVIDHAVSNNMHVSFGIIVNSLEKEDAPFCAWVHANAIENNGRFEFWHHGWDHGLGFMLDGVKMRGEFSGPPYEYQADHFRKAMKLFKDRTGLTFHSFGAPGNAFDSSTIRVLEEQPDIKVWLYGDTSTRTSKLVLTRPLNLEYAVGKVGFDEFVKGYAGLRSNEYFVLQGHPAMWSDESWTAYTRIVEILKKDKWEFVTPMEFHAYKTQKR